MRTIFNDPDQNRQFIEKGYVKVDLLQPGEVSDLLLRLTQMRPDDGFSPTGRGGNQGEYHCTFLDTNTAYKREANDSIREVFSPLLDKYCHEYKILTSNFYVKPPGGKGRFEIHQNWPTTPDFKEVTLTIWCPLVDVYRENGAIQVVEGSHKMVPDVATAALPPFFHQFEEQLIEKHLRPIKLKAGEGIIFDDTMIHWSSENNSDRPRYAIQIETVPKESTPVLYYYNRDLDAFELFELDSEWYVENGIQQVLSRPDNLRLVGKLPNPNRLLTLVEFEEKLKQGPATRDALWFGDGQETLADPVAESARKSFFRRLFG